MCLSFFVHGVISKAVKLHMCCILMLGHVFVQVGSCFEFIYSPILAW